MSKSNGLRFERSPLVSQESCFRLRRDYVCRTGSFFALSDHEIYLLAFLKIGVAGRLDFRVMNE